MNKEAFFQGVTDAFSDPKFTHEKAIPVLDTIFNHHNLTGLLGAGAGAGAGAIHAAVKKPEKGKKGHKSKGKSWLKSILGGALLGAGAGEAGSFIAPETSEAITDHLVRQPAGRVMTNLVSPLGYEDELASTKGAVTHADKIKQTPMRNILSSVLHDRPIYDLAKLDDGGDNVREPLYRAGFSLPSRLDKNHQPFIKNPDNTWSFNKDDPAGKTLLTQVAENYSGTGLNPGDKEVALNAATGNYIREALGNGAFKYSDTWDYDLHKDEALGTKGNWLRYFVNRISKPVRVEGVAEQSSS